MIPTLHTDDVVLPRDDSRHLQCTFDSFTSRVPEEERIKRGMGHHREKFFDETQIGFVECNAALTVDEGHTLISSSLANFRVAMAKIGDTDARAEVESFSAVVKFDVGALSFGHDTRGQSTKAFGDMGLSKNLQRPSAYENRRHP